jgi:excisionase family DNA binding protein
MPIQKRFKKPIVPLAEPQPITAGPRLLTIKDAAAYLSARVWAIRQLLRNREIPYVPVGRGFKIDKMDLDRWIERQKIGSRVAA